MKAINWISTETQPNESKVYRVKHKDKKGALYRYYNATEKLWSIAAENIEKAAHYGMLRYFLEINKVDIAWSNV
jgi:hypothetical protein